MLIEKYLWNKEKFILINMALEEIEKELENVKIVREDIKKELYSKVVKFANEARKRFGDIVKSVLIFGSYVKGGMKEGSDVDVFVILDDTSTKSSEDLAKVQTSLHLIATELKDLHIQTSTLTEFWTNLKNGLPELTNFLRYGLPIYDTGFIKPVQRMLNLGLISPSEEAIRLKAKSSNAKLKRVIMDMKEMIFELRYAAMDIIQAVIMNFYKAQPDYKDVEKYLNRLVEEKKLEKEYVEKFLELDKLWKRIEHKEIKDVDAKHLEKALNLSKDIIKRFEKILPKDIGIEEVYE